ncbi:hypothetical protein TH66_06230 [Carbonactinospora thermoautotrophica]|uniref:Putative DNA polymerase III n=1 Tax=Carbonactinospora thermoautotrophica TaxID=1469144 RepID=A0A132MTD3_9ACTN|nr:exonuclease domain-containing protein [Carbonactinospora thermoautotrophica]KWX01127.1 putative DNA polymerase III [Carbonactinospora thermoautotrophica]KWX04770.1 hypothetical protein TH66_06230 [Carbonactinospora thermoautotrophica]
MVANRYAGSCVFCRDQVPAGAGERLQHQGRWVTAHTECLPSPVPPPLGDHDGWHRGALVALDVETTGPDPLTDRIVSAGLYFSDGRSREWLIDPGVEIPAAATAVHGITTEHVREHGAPPGTALAELAAVLGEVIRHGVPLVVYRAPFDLTLLAAESRRHAVQPLAWERMLVIDPFVLDKHLDPYRRGRRTLLDVCSFYQVPLTDAHSALADATAALLLAQSIAARHPGIAAMAPAALHQAQIGWHAAQAASLQEYFERTGSAQPVDPAWPLRLPG